jgi:uncharacterized repeat protein (TIGR01451 family)
MIRDARGLRRPLLACAAAALAAAPAAFAASFVVTNTNTSGPGSLADAITQANGAPGPHTITFAISGTIPVSGGGFTLTESITITGPGLPSDLAIDGGDTSRIFTIAGAGKPVVLQNLTLSNANVTGSNGGALLVNPGSALTISNCSLVLNTTDSSGGALANLGTTTIANSTIANNFTSAGGGGAVYNDGTMTVSTTTVTSNSAPNNGGAFYNDSGGTLTLADSTFANNSASANGGGGGALANFGAATILRSTFSGNLAVGYGGAVRADASGAPGFGKLDVVDATFTGNVTNGNAGGGAIGSVNAGVVRLFSSTVANNVAFGTATGGGVYVSGSTFQLSNSILSNNVASPGNGQDCTGSLSSQGYNLVFSLEICTVTGTTTGNLTGVAANLGALASNGGPTQTMALNAGSPAIDAGNPAGCVDQNGVNLSTDQRGLPRPSGGRCDMGAFEVQVAPAALTVSKAGAGSVVSGQTLTYTLTYGNTGATAATSVVLRDTVPAGTTFVSATNGGSLVAGDVVWNIASLGAGITGQTVSFVVTVTAAKGTVTNGTYSIAASGIAPVAGAPVATAVTPAGGPGGIADVPALSPPALLALGLALATLGAAVLRRI